VGVEKLLPVKFAKIKLRQDALQTILSIFLDIFYPPNFRCFEENGLFQHPRLFTATSGVVPVTFVFSPSITPVFVAAVLRLEFDVQAESLPHCVDPRLVALSAPVYPLLVGH
jgi:hypothetical protein